MQGGLALCSDLVASPYRFLWHETTRTAIVSDLHLGAERSLGRAGISLPSVYGAPLLAAWERVLAEDPAQVVVAGDLMDSAEADLGEAEALLERVRGGCRVVLTPGNHDPAEGVLRRRLPRLEVVPYVQVRQWIVSHGDRRVEGVEGGRIVGHQHPAVVFRTRVHRAKMMCFAHTRNMVILPAFSRVPLGSNLLTEGQWIVDLPRPAARELRIAGIIEKVGEERVLDFGNLEELGTLTA